jgi:type IV pilus assembly protein PilB
MQSTNLSPGPSVVSAVAPIAPVPTPGASPARSVGEQLAERLLAAGHLTADQLALATRVHAKVAATRTLTSVLVELKHVTDDHIRDVMRRGHLEVPLGDLLVELGLVEAHELKLAQAMQLERSGATLADVLVDNHFVNEPDLTRVIGDQRGLPTPAVDGEPIDPALMKRAPIGTYKTHGFLPLKREGDRVVVVFIDPSSTTALDAARRTFGKDLVVGVVGRRAFTAALARAERDLTTAAAVSVGPEQGAVALVNKILDDAIASRVSDIHLEPARDRLRVRFRQDGVMMPHGDFALDQATSLVGRIKVMAGADIAERRRHQDGRIQYDTPRGTVDIRVSIYATIHGEKIVMRLLNNRDTLMAIKDIGMAPRMLELLQRDALDVPSGVVIVTGPTGSGKTTTLYGAVNYLNDAKTSIITAEDPVEYMIDGISQCSINPKINLGYAETLKHIVRQDPDVIVIGEIRDLFSAEVAINAALTGHKVLTTFHTEDSIGGLVRLLNMNIEAFLISSTVVSVVAQRLVRRVCPRCAEDHVLTPHELARLGYSPLEAAGLTFKRGRGCPACRHAGYKGRLAVFELLVLNELVRDAVLSRRSAYEIRRVCIEASGLVTLVEDGIAKAAAGLTSFEEIIRQLPRLSKPRPVGELRRLLGVSE